MTTPIARDITFNTRDKGYVYLATGPNGLRASCTWSRKEAVLRVLHKLRIAQGYDPAMPREDWQIEQVSSPDRTIVVAFRCSLGRHDG